MQIGIGSWSCREWFAEGLCAIFPFLDELKALGAELRGSTKS